MKNLIVVALEDKVTAARARELLANAAGQDLLVIDNASAANLGVSRTVQPTNARLRRIARLPVRMTSMALTGTLTAVAWTGLIVGGVAGEIAGRLADLREDNALPKNVQQAVQAKDTTLVLVSDEDLPEGLKEQIRQLHGRVWRTPLTEEQAAQFDLSLAGVSADRRPASDNRV